MKSAALQLSDYLDELRGVHQARQFGVPETLLTPAPARAGALQLAQSIREAMNPLREVFPLDYGAVVLCIPEFDYEVLKLRYPDMFAPDNEIRLRATRRFLASPESLPYKVNRFDGRKGKVHV